jgi:hypothetical protein
MGSISRTTKQEEKKKKKKGRKEGRKEGRKKRGREGGKKKRNLIYTAVGSSTGCAEQSFPHDQCWGKKSGVDGSVGCKGLQLAASSWFLWPNWLVTQGSWKGGWHVLRFAPHFCGPGVEGPEV